MQLGTGSPNRANSFSLSDSDFFALAGMLESETGIALNDTKKPMMVARLTKRLRQLGLTEFSQYRSLVESNKGQEEFALMVSTLTTNVTRFLRERQHFDTLRGHTLPGLIARARRGGRVRIWSAGCSTGEEPYSLALTLLSMCPEAPDLDIRILATDLDPVVVDKANTGTYPEGTLSIVPKELRQGFFPENTPTPGMATATRKLRQLVSFRILNLLHDWPFKNTFDIIFCRNVVIYFAPETQNSIWMKFAEKLPPGGHLFIGHSERLSPKAQELFSLSQATTYLRNTAPVCPVASAGQGPKQGGLAG